MRADSPSFDLVVFVYALRVSGLSKLTAGCSGVSRSDIHAITYSSFRTGRGWVAARTCS